MHHFTNWESHLGHLHGNLAFCHVTVESQLVLQGSVCVLQGSELQGTTSVLFSLNKNLCVFQVSRAYLGFCSDPKHFIEKSGQKILKKMTKIYKLEARGMTLPRFLL